jgi:hypothetical protein
MPAWLHNRADHIRRKNPEMPKSQAFAIATQQSHATGHTPKNYGTPEGKRKAKQKYDEAPSSYEQTADPKEKKAMLLGFADELKKIAAATPGIMPTPKPMLTKPKPTSMPRGDTMPAPSSVIQNSPASIHTTPATMAGSSN